MQWILCRGLCVKSRCANLIYKASLPAANLAGQTGGKREVGARCWAGTKAADAQVDGARRSNQNVHYHIGISRVAFRLRPSPLVQGTRM